MDLEAQMTQETMDSLSLRSRRNESLIKYSEGVVAPKNKKISRGTAVKMECYTVEAGYAKFNELPPAYENFSEMEDMAKDEMKRAISGLTNRDDILDVMHKFAHNKVKAQNAFLSQGNLAAALNAREDEIDETHERVRKNPKGDWVYLLSVKEKLERARKGYSR